LRHPIAGWPLWAWLLAASALGVVLGLLAGRWAEGGAAPAAWRGTVRRVIDGDTLVAAGRRGPVTVRLAGIDAPERAQPCGAEAKAALLAYAPPGEEVAVRHIGVWTHGRPVAWVAARPGPAAPLERDLSLLMVRSGHAYPYPGKPCYPRCAELAAAEEEARAARRGCWAAGEPERPWAYRERIMGKR